jgi:type IV pilus assembly protein PilM
MKITTATKHHRKTYFFKNKPLFGFDIGHGTIKVMQLGFDHKVLRLIGFGSAKFHPEAIKDGVIVKPEIIAEAATNLFKHNMTGIINTNRVAVSLPASRAISRAVRLPKMSAKDIDQAVQTEVEQYIPGQLDNFHLDHTTLREDAEGIELLVVAMPKLVVDSYLTFTHLLGLEAVLFDTAIGASVRLFALEKESDIPSVLVDFGATSTDITVFNHGLIVTGTIAFGGDHTTNTISNKLNVTYEEAIMLKSRYGLSPSVVQGQITAAMEPSLGLLIKEIRRAIRYYEQRYSKEPPIGQVITMGGGANMPGLTDYLIDKLRLPVRPFDPALHIDFGLLRHFDNADRMSYATAAGLAVANPAEVFA